MVFFLSEISPPLCLVACSYIPLSSRSDASFGIRKTKSSLLTLLSVQQTIKKLFGMSVINGEMKAIRRRWQCNAVVCYTLSRGCLVALSIMGRKLPGCPTSRMQLNNYNLLYRSRVNFRQANCWHERCAVGVICISRKQQTISMSHQESQ